MLDKEILNNFNQYVKKYVLSNKRARDKFHHTYRVLEYAKQIGRSLNLKDKKMHTLFLCALLHDIGRFEQITKYNTFKDIKSIDHGDLGYDILKEGLINEFTKDKIEQESILFAVKNHNKLDIPKSSIDNIMYIKIVRDADKMDILKEQGLTIKDHKPVINKETLKTLYSMKLISNKYVNTDVDVVFRYLGFIFDINYKYTYNFILEEKIVDNKINLVEIYTSVDLSDLKNHLINYINKNLQA